LVVVAAEVGIVIILDVIPMVAVVSVPTFLAQLFLERVAELPALVVAMEVLPKLEEETGEILLLQGAQAAEAVRAGIPVMAVIQIRRLLQAVAVAVAQIQVHQTVGRVVAEVSGFWVKAQVAA
jgi:hypothetical protein